MYDVAVSRTRDNVPWTRFWVPRDKALLLDSRSYLADPEGEYGAFPNPSLRTLDGLVSQSCLGLLGEPGIGKSRVLRAYVDAAKGQLPSGEELFFVDLALNQDLDRDVADAEEFRRWMDGQMTLHLFVDSLDEHSDGGAINAAKWFLKKLERLKPNQLERLRLRIACRTGEWPPVFDEKLPHFWKNDEIGLYELAPLQKKDVEAAAGSEASGFLQEVDAHEATALAIRPITLNFLLEEYHRHHKLPSKRYELYERGCQILCENSDIRDADHVGKLSAEQRLPIAARLAAVAILGRRPLIWRGADRGDVPPEAVRERDLRGGSEPITDGQIPVDDAAVREVITMTSLFTGRGKKGMGFAHQTYAEFLTAWFLKNRRLSTAEILRELTSASVPGKVIPELRETAAWVASMDTDILKELLESDPETLLSSDFAMVGDAERETLIGSLLRKIDAKQLLDAHLFWRHKKLKKLTHPTIAEQLQQYIAAKDKYFMARRAAINIAEACNVRVLQGLLADVALDATDNIHIREEAARAIMEIGDRATKRRLQPLAFDQCGPDPDDELKGLAINALWPADLTADELFANLIIPKRQNFGGSYQGFFSRNIANDLDDSGLCRALEWTSTLPPRHADAAVYVFNDLMDEIHQRAFNRLDEPRVRSAFAWSVRSRLEQHDGIFGQRNYTASAEGNLGTDNRRRRILLKALLALPPIKDEDVVLVFSASLALSQDVPSIIEWLKEEPSSEVRARWGTILRRILDRDWSFETLNPTIACWLEGGSLRDALQLIFHEDSVEIESVRADDLRKLQREEKARFEEYERMAKEHPREVLPASEKIKDLLQRFEEGHIEAGWHLSRWLEIDPKGKVYGDDCESDLTRLPGWVHADEHTRTWIITVARTYVFNTTDERDSWLAKEQLYYPAVAGYRYLRLLAQLDTTWIDTVPDHICFNWIGILLNLHEGTKEKLVPQLVRKAYRANPSELLAVLYLILNNENRSDTYSSVLDRIALCWDEQLGKFLLDFLQSTELKPRMLGNLLQELIKCRIAGAEDYAASLLPIPSPTEELARERALEAAHALLLHSPNAGWPILWPVLQNDLELGRNIIFRAARSINFRKMHTLGDRMLEADAVELFLWLEEQFPKTEVRTRKRLGMNRVTDEEMVRDLQSRLLNNLTTRGTAEAVSAVEQISKALPDRDLTWAIVSAKEAMTQGLWTPRSVRDIIALCPAHVITQPPIGSALRIPLQASAKAETTMARFHAGFALVVGIADYARVSKLPPSVLNDATDIAELLRSPSCGYPAENVRLLLDAQASAENLRRELRWLADRANAAGENATALVFFSGHGGRLVTGSTTSQYIIPFDCNLADLVGTAISNTELTAAFRAIVTPRLVVILDCCHAGGAAETKELVPGDSAFKLGLDEDDLTRLAQGRGRVIMASSRATELSLVMHGQPNSLFTGYLLEALRGKANTRGDGLIRVMDVFDYVSEKVPQAGDQHPILKVNDLEKNFAIALYRGGEKSADVARPVPPDVNLMDLREKLIKHFNTEALADLCFDMQESLAKDGKNLLVSLDIVGGDGLPAKARKLIEYMNQRQLLEYLIRAVRVARPGVI